MILNFIKAYYEGNSELEKNSEVRIQESKSISGGLSPAILLLNTKSNASAFPKEKIQWGLQPIYSFPGRLATAALSASCTEFRFEF